MDEGACDCDGNVLDCAGDCGGSAELDDCGVCNGDNADDLGCGCFEDGPSGCDDECGSTAVEDDCGVCDGDGSSCVASLGLGAFDASGSLEVTYDFGGPVAGFQFDVTGVSLTGASGGAAGDAGLTVSVGGATVLGFSFDNSEIAAGSGVLTILGFSDVTAGSTDLTFGNFGALTDASGNVYDAGASGSIDHGDPDCSGDYYGSLVEDCAGDCGGDSVLSGCDNLCNSTAVEDCAGDCGGSAELDECGVCNGSGIVDGACDCDGNVEDCAGECDGTAIMVTLCEDTDGDGLGNPGTEIEECGEGGMDITDGCDLPDDPNTSYLHLTPDGSVS
jgi:hypothetical protein